MSNLIERYGRENDEKALLAEMPVLGQRMLNESLSNFFIQHKSKMTQVTYVVEGSIDFLIDGQVYTVNKGEFIINRPDQVFGALNDTFPASKTIFFKVDTSQKIEGWNEHFRLLFQNFISVLKNPHSSPGPGFYDIFLKILKEHRNRDSLSQLKSRLYFQELLIALYESYNNHLPNQSVSTFDSGDIEKVNDFILKNIHRKIYTKELADLVGLSESYFRLIFFQSFGYSPNDYLVKKRIDVAKQLLLQPRRNITDISYDLGFSSSQYFANTFKKLTGFRPKDYKKAVSKAVVTDKLSGDTESSQHMDKFFT